MNKSISKLSPARKIAYECLDLTRKRNGHARDILDRLLVNSHLDQRDKSFATKLTLGVVSTKGTLDAIINRCLNKAGDIKADVRIALEISTYELVFLSKPAHIVVDQGVLLVADICPKARGLANSVLRKIARLVQNFPFGNQDSDIRVAATKFGFPLWMASKLESIHGPIIARYFMETSNNDAPVFIAINSLRSSCDEILSKFNSLGTKLQPVSSGTDSIPGCYYLSNPQILHDDKIKKLFSDGKILIADGASQLVVYSICKAILSSTHISTPKSAASFSALELCSGRATKTILLQSIMNFLASTQFKPFVAVDNIAFKVDLSKKRVKDYGVSIDEIICADILNMNDSDIINCVEQMFDIVFLDSPCTGTGTLRRHPEIRWKLTQEDVLACARQSFNLLKSASKYVNINGLLVYATCSFEPEENELVIEQFLRSTEAAGFELQNAFHTSMTEIAHDVEHPELDSHFCAIFKKIDK